MPRSAAKPARRRRRSKFEIRVEIALARRAESIEYESERLQYRLSKHYVPDFSVTFNQDDTGDPIIFEAKGRFTSFDRSKMIAVKEAHPDRDIRLVFMRNNPLYKGSKSTYMDWAAKHGFKATVFPELPL